MGRPLANSGSKILSFEDLRVLGGLGSHLQNRVPCGLLFSLALFCPGATVRSPRPFLLFYSVHLYYAFFFFFFHDDLVNRSDVEAGLFWLHPPHPERMGCSALLSLANQQTPRRAAGHLREQSKHGWQVGRVKSPTSFVLEGRLPCVLFSHWLK